MKRIKYRCVRFVTILSQWALHNDCSATFQSSCSLNAKKDQQGKFSEKLALSQYNAICLPEMAHGGKRLGGLYLLAGLGRFYDLDGKGQLPNQSNLCAKFATDLPNFDTIRSLPPHNWRQKPWFIAWKKGSKEMNLRGTINITYYCMGHGKPCPVTIVYFLLWDPSQKGGFWVVPQSQMA